MKRLRSREGQVIWGAAGHEAGAKTADLARKHGRIEQRCTIEKPSTPAWTFEAMRLKQLEEEAKPKKLLAGTCAEPRTRLHECRQPA
jgi:putative transposase